MTVTTPARLDAELVRRGLARSRAHAADLVAHGRVRIDGRPVARAATAVGPDGVLEVDVDPQDPGYASRAAHKLADALDAWGSAAPRVADAVCLDAGASTGGFTDVLLRRGARHVVAVDVGHDQLVARLRDDPRVEVRERVNVRDLRQGDVVPAPTVVVGDLSFISLTLVLAPLLDVAAAGADMVLLVKPQFEVGRERLGAEGVVRDPALWRDALDAVVGRAAGLGATVRDVRPSTLPGTHGNVEFVLRLRAPGGDPSPGSDGPGDLSGVLDAAVEAARGVPGEQAGRR